MQLLLAMMLFAAPNSMVPDEVVVWAAPATPDPGVILEEARNDFQNSRYRLALKKRIWFHEHSLTHDPSMYGVRLSYNLLEWFELAKVHPPAMVAFLVARDRAEAEALTADEPHNPFHDMEAINGILGQGSRTVATFKKIREQRPQAAGRLFNVAQEALLAAKEYDLYSQYLQPQRDFQRASRSFRIGIEYAESLDDPVWKERHLEYTYESFQYDVSKLVSVLTVTGRREEAQAIADQATEVVETPEFADAVKRALAGRVPAQWP